MTRHDSSVTHTGMCPCWPASSLVYKDSIYSLDIMNDQFCDIWWLYQIVNNINRWKHRTCNYKRVSSGQVWQFGQGQRLAEGNPVWVDTAYSSCNGLPTHPPTYPPKPPPHPPILLGIVEQRLCLNNEHKVIPIRSDTIFVTLAYDTACKPSCYSQATDSTECKKVHMLAIIFNWQWKH